MVWIVSYWTKLVWNDLEELKKNPHFSFLSRTNQLMEEFCMVTESSFFYGCLWECVLSSSTARLPAFTYVLSHYNKKQAMDDQLHFMGNSIDLLVS